MAYTIFYLVVMHTAYFMYIHFTESFHRASPPNANWFQVPFAVLTAIVIGVQIAAFIVTTKRRKVRELIPIAPTVPAD